MFQDNYQRDEISNRSNKYRCLNSKPYSSVTQGDIYECVGRINKRGYFALKGNDGFVYMYKENDFVSLNVEAAREIVLANKI